ncbi:hypothetical protein ARSEF1564_003444, partial [Beauveria bassiana]
MGDRRHDGASIQAQTSGRDQDIGATERSTPRHSYQLSRPHNVDEGDDDDDDDFGTWSDFDAAAADDDAGHIPEHGRLLD